MSNNNHKNLAKRILNILRAQGGPWKIPNTLGVLAGRCVIDISYPCNDNLKARKKQEKIESELLAKKIVEQMSLAIISRFFKYRIEKNSAEKSFIDKPYTEEQLFCILGQISDDVIYKFICEIWSIVKSKNPEENLFKKVIESTTEIRGLPNQKQPMDVIVFNNNYNYRSYDRNFSFWEERAYIFRNPVEERTCSLCGSIREVIIGEQGECFCGTPL